MVKLKSVHCIIGRRVVMEIPLNVSTRIPHCSKILLPAQFKVPAVSRLRETFRRLRKHRVPTGMAFPLAFIPVHRFLFGRKADGDRKHGEVAINKEGSGVEDGGDGGGFCFHSLTKSSISRFMSY